MQQATSPMLPDGSAPPVGTAAIVLSLFDPMGIVHGAYSRAHIEHHLAAILKRAVPRVEIDAVVTSLIGAGFLAELGRRADPSLGIDDGPGGDDEAFVTTPIGKKAARLCNWLAGRRDLVGGAGKDGNALDDLIVEAIGEGESTLEVIDAACCCAATSDVRSALDALVEKGFVRQRGSHEFELRAHGTARHAQLRDARKEHLAGDLMSALGEVLVSSPAGEEGRPLRAAAFDARAFHAEIASTCRALFVDGHFADAVLAGCKRSAHLVQARSGSSLDGDQLFATAFKADGGVLKFNSLSTQDDKNEQRGMMLLFQGMWAAIRNPNAHRFLRLDQVGALEHLGFLSLLLRYLDTARS